MKPEKQTFLKPCLALLLLLAALFGMAFMLGVLPLVVGSGAGANSRHAIGTGVFGGILCGTLLTIFFVPLFFMVIMRVFSGKSVSKGVR